MSAWEADEDEQRLLDVAERLLEQAKTLLEMARISTRTKWEPEDPARFDVPDVNRLAFAVFEAGGKLRPVAAREIAVTLWGDAYGHGDLVKLGQRLGMMASVGLVERHRNADWSVPNRWSLPNVDA